MKRVNLRDIYNDCLLDDTDHIQVGYDKVIVHQIPSAHSYYFKRVKQSSGDWSIELSTLYKDQKAFGPNNIRQTCLYLEENLKRFISTKEISEPIAGYIDGIYSMAHNTIMFVDVINTEDGKEEIVDSFTYGSEAVNLPVGGTGFVGEAWKDVLSYPYFPTKSSGDFVITYVNSLNDGAHDRIFYPESEIRSFVEYEDLIDLDYIWEKLSHSSTTATKRLSNGYPAEFRQWVSSKERMLTRGYNQLSDDIITTVEIVAMEEDVDNSFDLTDPKHPAFNKLPGLTRNYFSDPQGAQILWRLLKPATNLTWKESQSIDVFPMS